MNDQVSTILNSTNLPKFEEIARAVLDDSNARLIARPEFQELTTSHNDLRTIGIVRVSGHVESEINTVPWSTVVKIIDPTAGTQKALGPIVIENEQRIYETNLLSSAQVLLRPAKCYRTEQIDNRYRVLWLEDLTNALQPPWSLEQFISASNHLGQFAGYHIVEGTSLPFEVSSNWYKTRFSPEEIKSRVEALLREQDSKSTHDAYGKLPVENAMHLAELLEQLFTAGQSVEHCLSMGDSHSRNLFPLGTTTVGIDWGLLGSEPVGADVGVLIGSSLSFTVEEALLIGAHEKEIYESYVDGLVAAGWNGTESHVRIGFFCQFAGYLATLSAVPVVLRNYESRREWVEGRFGVPFDDVPKHLAPVIELIPGYIRELEELLDSGS